METDRPAEKPKVWERDAMIDLEQLKNMAIAKLYVDGSVIIQEGDVSKPYCMYILLKGSVGVYRNYGQTKETHVATLKPGDFFGEMSMFLQEPRTATVIAHEGVLVLEINQSNAHEFIESQPGVAYSVIKTLCLRIQELNRAASKFDEGQPLTRNYLT